MKRATQLIILAAIVLCLAAFAGADANQVARSSGADLTVRLRDDGQPAPKPVQPLIRPGRKSDRIERVSVPVAGEQLSDFIPVESAPGIHHNVPPLPKFKKGVFHRYRPRDPTAA